MNVLIKCLIKSWLITLTTVQSMVIRRYFDTQTHATFFDMFLLLSVYKFSEATGGCTDGYTITLGTNGQTHQSDTAGNYYEVCASDGYPIFRHESSDLYLYFLENSGTKFWIGNVKH